MKTYKVEWLGAPAFLVLRGRGQDVKKGQIIEVTEDEKQQLLGTSDKCAQARIVTGGASATVSRRSRASTSAANSMSKEV